MKAWFCWREMTFEPVDEGEHVSHREGFDMTSNDCPVCERDVTNRGCGFQDIKQPYVDYTP